MTRKSQNNNVVNKLNNVANNINNNVRNVVQNEMLINTIRVLIIIYIAFGIPIMNSKHLNVVNDNIVRLVIVALIVYLAFMDIVTAVLLTIAFIVTLHHAKNTSANNARINQVNDVAELVEKVNNIVNNKEGYENNNQGNQNNNNEQETNNANEENNNLNTINDSTNVLAQNASGVNGYDSDEENANAGANFDGKASAQNQSNTEAVNNGNAFNAAPNPSGNNAVNNANNNAVNNANNNANNNVLDLNNIPKAFDNNNKELSVFDEVNNAAVNNLNNNNNNEDAITQLNKNQPASETLTDSILRAQGAQMDVNAPMGLTTSANLYDISENAVPGADIMNQVKTIQDQHGAQGMDYPHGVGAKRYDGFHFDQDNHPNLQHEMLRNERIE